MRTVGLVVALAMGAGASGCGVSNTQADRFLADQARKAGETVISTLSQNMRDPGATRWGAVWAHRGRICGTFNPRNSDGSYAGLKRFVGRQGGMVLIDGVSSSDNFNAEWGAYCGHAHQLIRTGEPPGPPIHPMTKEERAAEQAAYDARPIKLTPGAGVEA